MQSEAFQQSPWGWARARVSGPGALAAGGWTVLGYGALQGLRFVANLVLARVLFPEAFGLAALANGVAIGLQMMSDLGIQASVVRRPIAPEPVWLDTAWSLQVVRGAALGGLAWLFAAPVASVYADGRIVTLLELAALAAVVLGFQSTAVHVAMRRQQLARLTCIDLIAHVCALAISLLAAWKWQAVWSLGVGAPVHAAIRVTLSHTALPGHLHRFRWDRASIEDLLAFGRWIVVSTFLTFLAFQTDRLLLGMLESIERVGLYAIAVGFVAMPRELFTRLCNAALLPHLAAQWRSGSDAFQVSLVRLHKLVLHLALTLLLVLVAVAPLLFSALYDERYAAVGGLVQWLAIPCWFHIATAVPERALIAMGRSRELAMTNLVRFTAGIGGATLGQAFLGIEGFILGLSLGGVAAQGLIWSRVHHSSPGMRTTDLTHTALLLTGFVLSQLSLRDLGL